MINSNFINSIEERRIGSIKKFFTSIGGILLFLGLLGTAVHAVGISLEYFPVSESDMNFVRVVSPVFVELAAGWALYGTLFGAWEEAQKPITLIIDIFWLCFAGLNLVVSFSVEGGEQLPVIFGYYLAYGFPLSGLVALALVYAVERTDPKHIRLQQKTEAINESERIQFTGMMQQESLRQKAILEVMSSKKMAEIIKQQAWLDYIHELQRGGTTEEQLNFLLHDFPMLHATVSGADNALPKPRMKQLEDSSPPSGVNLENIRGRLSAEKNRMLKQASSPSNRNEKETNKRKVSRQDRGSRQAEENIGVESGSDLSGLFGGNYIPVQPSILGGSSGKATPVSHLSIDEQQPSSGGVSSNLN